MLKILYSPVKDGKIILLCVYKSEAHQNDGNKTHLLAN